MGKEAVSVILAVIFCFTSGCAVLGRKYTDKQMGYSIRPPANWVSGAPSKEHPNIRVFVSPHVSGEHLRPSLNILVENTDLGVEEYVEKQKIEALTPLKGFRVILEDVPEIGQTAKFFQLQLISEDALEIGKRWRLVYRLKEAKTGESVVCSQDFIIEGGKVYLITFMASEPQWENLKETFALSAESFKIRRK